MLKNSLKSGKKFNSSSQMNLWSLFLTCFCMAMLSMAGNCTPDQEAIENAARERDRKLSQHAVTTESLVNFSKHLKQLGCKTECAFCKNTIKIQAKDIASIVKFNCTCQKVYHDGCVKKLGLSKTNHKCPTCNTEVRITCVVDNPSLPLTKFISIKKFFEDLPDGLPNAHEPNLPRKKLTARRRLNPGKQKENTVEDVEEDESWEDEVNRTTAFDGLEEEEQEEPNGVSGKRKRKPKSDESKKPKTETEAEAKAAKAAAAAAKLEEEKNSLLATFNGTKWEDETTNNTWNTSSYWSAYAQYYGGYFGQGQIKGNVPASEDKRVEFLLPISEDSNASRLKAAANNVILQYVLTFDESNQNQLNEKIKACLSQAGDDATKAKEAMLKEALHNGITQPKKDLHLKPQYGYLKLGEYL